jgi:hypothetical protein
MGLWVKGKSEIVSSSEGQWYDWLRITERFAVNDGNKPLDLRIIRVTIFSLTGVLCLVGWFCCG